MQSYIIFCLFIYSFFFLERENDLERYLLNFSQERYIQIRWKKEKEKRNGQDNLWTYIQTEN